MRRKKILNYKKMLYIKKKNNKNVETIEIYKIKIK